MGVACALGAMFWIPSLGAGRGWFPTPLDDVFIHFGFARSVAHLRPFEWISGQGFSSGETSPLYALLLALGWALGFRDRALGVWAALIAVASVASFVGSVRRLVRPCPVWLGWLLGILPLSFGVVGWTLFSGMEVAALAAVLGRSLEALARARESSRTGPTRESRQWRLGAWGAALVLSRPEAVVVVAVFALASARGAGPRSSVLALLRAASPGALATASVLAVNRLATGDARSAGAQLKLLSSNPYLSDVDRARTFVENLVTFWVKVVKSELAVTPALVGLFAALPLAGLFGRHRPVVAACAASAVGWALLVTTNSNAPHHNFRYYVPALLLASVAASLGIATIARARRGALFAGLLGLSVIASAAPKLPAQIRHYRAASANIRDQHIEVGERLARLPDDAVVLLGDAGAIPYVSGRAAIDALGLGGYRGMPFARAATHGEAATIELIERLAPAERPTHLALYPNWFDAITSRFGVEIDRVTIDNNVICGSPTKAIYRADWSALDVPRAPRAGVVDELDVGDVIDEAAHAYAPPLPHGGWTSLDVLVDAGGARRFDGGRTIPAGKTESFTVRRSAEGPLSIRVRVDAEARAIVMHTARGSMELTLEPPRAGHWRAALGTLERVEAGERITLEARGGDYRNYHVWIEQVPTSALAR